MNSVQDRPHWVSNPKIGKSETGLLNQHFSPATANSAGDEPLASVEPESMVNPFALPEPRERRLPALRDRDAIRLVLGMSDFDETCPLAGHGGDAHLEVAADGVDLNFACDCNGSFPGAHFRRSLSDVYWSIRTGKEFAFAEPLHGSKRYLARLLLTHELGLIEPATFELRCVDPESGTAVHQVRELFDLVYGLRLTNEPETVLTEGIAFAGRLVAELLGLSKYKAGEAITSLVEQGVIVKVGEYPSAGRPGSLFAPECG